jgi:3-hydroxyisobutyrate dehydrogenase-like beta-hydroxyacid dehydrogenase
VPDHKSIGFIGVVGAMGGPICRNLVKRSSAAVTLFDLEAEPLAPAARGRRQHTGIIDSSVLSNPKFEEVAAK